MAVLTLPTFQGMLDGMAAAAQAACTAFLDSSVGSPLRAIFQASASQWSWQQDNIYKVLLASRLATSKGADVDSFVGDYGLTRLPASPATGSATVARFASVGSATLPVSTLLLSSDGSQQFVVGADVSNPLYQPAAGGYVLPQGTNSVTVPITALVPGTDGNVVAGAISLFGVGLPGLDTVTNDLPLTNGSPAEADQSLRDRFVLYIASLERGTKEAIENAIAGTQAGLSYLVLAGVDASGSDTPGRSVAFVDDGSGRPPAALISSVQARVDAVRALGEQVAVLGPVVVPASVSLTLTVAAGVNKVALFAPVAAAIFAFVDSLPIGGELSATKIANVAYGVDRCILNVSNISINGSLADLLVSNRAVVKLSMSPVVS